MLRLIDRDDVLPGCRRQLAKWRRARSFVCLLVEEVGAAADGANGAAAADGTNGSAAAADKAGQPGRLLGTATLSLMQVRWQQQQQPLENNML